MALHKINTNTLHFALYTVRWILYLSHSCPLYLSLTIHRLHPILVHLIFFLSLPLSCSLFTYQSSSSSPALPLLLPKNGSHVACTLRGTNLPASAANSYKLGCRGIPFLNSIPTICNCVGNNDPLRPLHFLQHVTVFSHVNFPPIHRGKTWSNDRSEVRNRLEQYWHRYPSRRKTLRLVNAGFYIMM